jgi:Ca-activated chloride channel family protein
MTGLSFDDLRWLHLLWVVLAVGLVGLYGVARRRTALRRFAAAALLPRQTPPTGLARPLLRLWLVVVALAALVAALIGPRWGEQAQTLLRRNIDVLVLLDVSRSMLARDIAPNRLERAKLAIRDDLLPALGGDRIGLIAFAGVPTLVCPLTSDYGFFRLALDDVSPLSAPRGGTNIGDAIRKAEAQFEHGLETHKIVILITDGEDHESYPLEAASNLWRDQQVPIVALALGDPEQGARIPVRNEQGESFLEYGGQIVRSRAAFSTLEQVARVSNQGVFVAVGTSNFDLGDIYRRVAAGVRAEEEQSQRRVRQPAQMHPFALAALLLVLMDSLLREGPAGVAVRAVRRAAQEEAA